MSIWHDISEGWKDLIDPGRHARDEYNNILNSENARMNSERNSLISNAKNTNLNNTSYLNQYINQLRGLADTNYNQGVTSLQRGIANTNATLQQNMANRGINGSGVDMKALAGNQSTLARGISALQAQRQYQKADDAQNIMNKAQNTYNTSNENLLNAYSYQGSMNQATQSQLGQLQQEANQESPLLQLAKLATSAALGGATGGSSNILGANSMINKGVNWLKSKFGGGSNDGQYQLQLANTNPYASSGNRWGGATIGADLQLQNPYQYQFKGL